VVKGPREGCERYKRGKNSKKLGRTKPDDRQTRLGEDAPELETREGRFAGRLRERGEHLPNEKKGGSPTKKRVLEKRRLMETDGRTKKLNEWAIKGRCRQGGVRPCVR